MYRCPRAFLLLGLSLLPVLGHAQGDLGRYQAKNRLLLVFAPAPADPRWAQQDRRLAGRDAPFRERALLRFDLFEQGDSRGPNGAISPREAARLRKRYGIKAGRFRVLLVGKDGHVAFASSTPVALRELTGRIDQMPMRQAEMRRRGER